ncbi:MAG: replication factor C small subunit [Candidatus Lokiarchaeota archaeon]|nr:replication factor C small subunit [Candidatus Lokiarchaeota archaeon]
MTIEQPWTEKYRPRHLKDVVGQSKIVERLTQFVEDKSMPHLIFAGPAGTGKTTSALALTRDILERNMKYNQTFLELNASDARGIDVIRTMVKDFAKSVVPSDVPFKILILDEADNMTSAAQQALRRTMENYTHTCRMILICNYSNKIILPIQSRCAVFRFAPLDEDEIKNRIKMIAKEEDVEFKEDGLKALIYVSNGDLRRAVNYLQACSTVSGAITEELVYKITGKIHPDEIRQMVNQAVEGKLMKSKEMLDAFISEYGLSARNLVAQIHSELYYMDTIPEVDKVKIIRILSQIDYRLSQGATEKIQLNALLAKLCLLNTN